MNLSEEKFNKENRIVGDREDTMSERGYDENAVRGGKKRERENKEVTFNNTPQRYRRGRH